ASLDRRCEHTAGDRRPFLGLDAVAHFEGRGGEVRDGRGGVDQDAPAPAGTSGRGRATRVAVKGRRGIPDGTHRVVKSPLRGGFSASRTRGSSRSPQPPGHLTNISPTPAS